MAFVGIETPDGIELSPAKGFQYMKIAYPIQSEIKIMPGGF